METKETTKNANKRTVKKQLILIDAIEMKESKQCTSGQMARMQQRWQTVSNRQLGHAVTT